MSAIEVRAAATPAGVTCHGCDRVRVFAVAADGWHGEPADRVHAVISAAMVAGWLMYPVAKWYCPKCVALCQPTPAHQASVAVRARILGGWR